MEINVTIEQVQPLVGMASTDRNRTVPFSGWLELLRAIAELVEEMPRPNERAPEERDACQLAEPVRAAERPAPLQPLSDWSLS